jgi:hypothetical protein
VGPPLDSPKAAAFLDFWGKDIADKTRFQVCCLFASLPWPVVQSAGTL